MSFDWNEISEKVYSCYEQMEYHPEYDIERFIQDLEIEISRNEVADTPVTSTEYSEMSGYLRFRNTFEYRRSILTKLFSFTNNPRAVDTLIEYCDYYEAYYSNEARDKILAAVVFDSDGMLFRAFNILAYNPTTKRVLDDVWRMLCSKASLLLWVSRFDSRAILVATVVMADADLNAAIRALVQSHGTYFQVSRVLVQEPIREHLLEKLRNYGCEIEIEVNSNLFVFRNTEEALGNLNGKNKFGAVSLWSENIIAAKKFSADLKSDTVWINAHGVVSAGLHSLIYESRAVSLLPPVFDFADFNEAIKDGPVTDIKIVKIYNLFYGGKWQEPEDRKYWTNKAGISFALGTKKDLLNCVHSARGAFKIWRSKKMSERAKIIRCFAERLRTNGNHVYSNIVQQSINRPFDFVNTVSLVNDGAAEIISTPQPVGVVAIASTNLKMLFRKLITASIAGNAVIIISTRNDQHSFAEYCDYLGTCGFPSGVINCLSDISSLGSKLIEQLVDGALPLEDFPKSAQTVLDENMLYNRMFTRVTRPKSVWLQCN